MTPTPKSHERAAFLALFINFLVFGAITTIIGATLPMIIQGLRWNDLQAGIVIASHSIGYFTATLLSGLLAPRFGFQKLIGLGLLLQAMGIGFFGVRAEVVWNVGAFLLVGLGQGATELVTNYCVVQMETPGRSRLMNLMHSAFTLGAIVAPVLIGFLTAHAIPWRMIFLGLCILSLFLAMGFQGKVLHFLKPVEDGGETRRGLLSALRHRLLLLMTITLLLYVGVEMGVSAWIAVYFVRVFQTPPSLAAYVVSIFWAGILLGRLGISLIRPGVSKTLVLFLFSSFSSLCLGGALLTHISGPSALLFFGVGLGYSVVYPTVMSMVGEAHPEKRGVAIGVASAGGGIGMCVFPFFMSALAEHFSIEAGFWFYFGVSFAMTATAGTIFRLSLSDRRRQGLPS